MASLGWMSGRARDREPVQSIVRFAHFEGKLL